MMNKHPIIAFLVVVALFGVCRSSKAQSDNELPQASFGKNQKTSAVAPTDTGIRAANPPEAPEGWSDGYLYANGVRLHYHHAVPAAEKPPLVIVHGITDNGLCWATLALKLQDDYDIYMLDARAHGLSDPFTTSDDADTQSPLPRIVCGGPDFYS